MKVVCLWFKTEAPLQKLAENCLRLSPQISLRGKEALFIEIGKCQRLYSEEGFLRRLQVILRRMDLHPSIAVGTDIPDALAFAKYQNRDMDALPLLALIELADPFNKDPIGQKYVCKMVESFTDLGIKSIGQFKKLPMAELVSRFGTMGILCQQRAKGQVSIPWPAWKPEEVISEKYEFSYFEFYGELEPILFQLKSQLDHIFQRLWARALKAQTIEVRIYCELNSANPEPFRLTKFEFLFPQGSTKGALNIIKERLAKDFQKKPFVSPIEAIETKVTQTVLGPMGQKNFFHAREETAEKLHSLLGQLTEAHGKNNIFHAELTEDRRPEKSWKRVESPLFQKTSKAISLEGKIPLRPTYLLTPERVEVTAGFIHIRKKPYKIISWSPVVERINGGWLETLSSATNAYHRDYYQAELESGTTLTLFQDPDQHYYLHGYFG